MTELETKQRDTSAGLLGVHPSELDLCIFPWVFGSTAGARGGISGSAMTTRYISAYVDSENGTAVLWGGLSLEESQEPDSSSNMGSVVQ